ncbi:MAG: 3,5-nucleoside bisphosphate phosphatase [Candidatus Hydrogenedentes bacterium]|nr:3,5-nucleoside bisphosphate phosphatase [Candidatus Hydrogenedentota bacterium]
MSAFVDLHLHTCYSDGADTPAELAARAAALGFAAIAVTDHDTVEGLAEARTAAEAHGMAFLDGVEISTRFNGNELHVVGLGIRPDHAGLLDALGRLRERRTERADAILAKLRQEGIPVTREQVLFRSGEGAIGRVHIAQELHAQGYAGSVQKAFEKYIGKGKRAFVAKDCMPCGEAVDLIHAAGGLAFIAHPGVGKTVERQLPRLLSLPFDGIEVYHSKHTPGHVTAFLQVAEEHGLLVSGGSDCHGAAKGLDPELGKVRVPYTRFEAIAERLAQPR